jgi:hypothetical protein
VYKLVILTFALMLSGCGKTEVEKVFALCKDEVNSVNWSAIPQPQVEPKKTEILKLCAERNGYESATLENVATWKKK